MDINKTVIPTERKVITLVAVLFLNLVLVSTHVVLKDQRTLFQTVVGVLVSPFQIAFQKTVDFVSHEMRHYVFLKGSFDRYHELKKKHTRLKYENYILKRKVADAEFLEQAKTLREQFIKADVISIDPNFPLDSMMINIGAGDGVEKHMIVLNEDGELVGKVVEPISPFSSRVRLITSAIDGVGAYIEKNRLEGLLTGNNDAICNFKYLIENKPVSKGDRVVTSGTDKIFPPYIPIGQVIKTRKEYLTQYVEVKPFFVEKSIKHLLVIRNIQQERGAPGTASSPGEE